MNDSRPELVHLSIRLLRSTIILHLNHFEISTNYNRSNLNDRNFNEYSKGTTDGDHTTIRTIVKKVFT